MSDAQLALIVLVLFAIAAGFILIRRNARRRNRMQESPYPSYIEGLHLLVENEQEEAAQRFRHAAEHGPYSLEARLRLGNLLREKGATVQAIKIHKAMLAIPGVPEHFINDLVPVLAQDYIAAGNPEAAIPLIEEHLLSHIDNPTMLELLIDAYECVERWDKALSVLERLDKVRNTGMSSRRALYLVLNAEKALSAGNTRKAKADLKRALSVDPRCIPAYLKSADLALEEGNIDKAVREWKSASEQSDLVSSLIFSKMEKALYEAGKYGKLSDVYGSLIDSRPDNVHVLLALARFEERKGDLQKALEHCRRAVELSPGSLKIHAAAAVYYADLEMSADAATEVREILKLLDDRDTHLRCISCGTIVDDIVWRCPTCGRIGLIGESGDSGET